MAQNIPSTGNSNDFKDHSGIIVSSANPYDALINACKGDPTQIQHRYQAHRETRNELQKAKLLDPGFSGWVIDPILEKLIHHEQYPQYVDPRNCLVFWARPPEHLRNLISTLQARLLESKHDLWLMPLDCLHMTTLEIAHSLSETEIELLVAALGPKIPEITDYTFSHRARLVKPLLSYDNQAVALSFLPASDRDSQRHKPNNSLGFTYHHLRRDIYNLCESTGVDVASRYTVPSAHLTIARFVSELESMKNETIGSFDIFKWVRGLEDINTWLKEEFWAETPGNARGDWVVGEEKGLDCRKGTLWYGGGTSVRVGVGS